MTKTIKLILLSFFFTITQIFCFSILYGQENSNLLRGKVLESGSEKPVSSAVISVLSTGEFTNSDEQGNFSIQLSKDIEKINVSLPGFFSTSAVIRKADEVVIYLTKEKYN